MSSSLLFEAVIISLKQFRYGLLILMHKARRTSDGFVVLAELS